MPPDPNTHSTSNPNDCTDDGKIRWIPGEGQAKLKLLLELAKTVLGTWGFVQDTGSVSQDTLLKFRWAAGLQTYKIDHIDRGILPFFQDSKFYDFVKKIRDSLKSELERKDQAELRAYKFQTYTPSKSERLKICQDLLGTKSNQNWNQKIKKLLNIDSLESNTILGSSEYEIPEPEKFVPDTITPSRNPTFDSTTYPPISATQVYLLVTCRRIEKSKENHPRFNIIPEIYAPELPGLENVFKIEAFYQDDPNKGCSNPHQEIRENLKSWVYILEESVLKQFGINQTQQSNIVIDLFLPHDFLIDVPENWEVLDDWDDCCLLGKYRGVILRSLNRVTLPGLALKLADHWQTFQTRCLQSRIEQGLVEIARDANPQTLEPQLAGKSIALLPEGSPEDAVKGAAILKVLLKSSVLIAVWPHDRPTNLNAARQHLEWVIQRQYLEDFGAAAIALKEARCAGEARGNVSFLADCPDRIPRMLQSSPLQMPR
jgi:hypothetical protein